MRILGSLSFRLLAIFVVLAGLFVFGALQAIRWVYDEDTLRGLLSGHLSLHVKYVLEDIDDPPRVDRARAITEQVPVDIRISGPDVEWMSHPEFPDLKDLEFGDSTYFGPEAWLPELENVDFAELAGITYLRLRQDDYWVVVASPKIGTATTGRNLLPIIIGLGLLLLLAAYISVRWLFSPIGLIRDGAAQMREGDFDYRIKTGRQDQLGELSHDINRLSAEVGRMLDAKRQLLLGINHELRTPLSRLRLAIELSENGDPGMLDDLREMESIIQSLLEAERLNEPHTALHRSPVDVGQLIQELVQEFFASFEDRLVLEMPDHPLSAELDGVRIQLMLKNLLSNALKYAPVEAGPVTLRVSQDGGGLRFDVIDRGPGISAEQAEHLGEPFFRADPSRNRDTGGSGLGLYLACTIAKAHGGTVWVEPFDQGAWLVARIPAG
ncbi:MAG: HAMP domain-containing sensor histidine kinase [Pseudomonadota bacterium]